MNMLPLYPTRYRNIFLLLLLVVAITNPTLLFAQQKEKAPLPGRLRIKVSPEFASQLRSARVRTARVGKDNVMLLGIRSLDDVHKRFKVNNFKRVFREAGVFEERHRKYGLDRWYEVVMDTTQSVEEALKAFGGLQQVEKVEPLYPKHHADVGPNGLKPLYVDGPPPGMSANGPNDPLFPAQWHYNNTGQTGGRPGADIHAVKAWQLETGKPNVVVAVMDGGIQYNHPDLAANMWRNVNEIPGNEIDDDNNGYVDDIYGYGFGDDIGDMVADMHGTHVAGTIAAVSNNGIGVAGVAGGSGNGDGVRLMSCAIFGRTNVGNFEEAYVYAADMGAVISQNSWSYWWGYEQTVLDAIDYFIAEAGKDNDGNQTGPMNGGTVIFAAGNESSSEYGTWPGAYDHVLGVASTTHNDTRAPYSNYGLWVDVAAPGGDTNNAIEQGVLSTLTPSAYGYLQGTSMACPHVSGIAALLASKLGGPGYDHTTLEQRLKNTTEDINLLNPGFAKMLGTGRVNATKALYLPDSLAPQSINDLSVSSILHTSLVVSWTSPIDENDFSVPAYDLRYSTNPITAENFNSAIAVNGVPSSLQQGIPESFTITGLTSNTTYYFAIKSIDTEGNVSELSNVVEQRTYFPPILEVSSYEVVADLSDGQTATKSITIYNHGEASLHYAFIYTQPEESHVALVEPEMGIVAGGDSASIEFHFRTLDLVNGSYRMDIVLTNNDPANSEPSIYTTLNLFDGADPVPHIEPASLDFGLSALHEAKRLNTLLKNESSEGDLVIDSIFFDSNLFATTITAPIVLHPFDTVTIPVYFTPVSNGDVQATMTLGVDWFSEPDVTVTLTGEGYDPYHGIAVRPQSLTETLGIGEASTQTLTIRNSSDQSVPIVIRATSDLYNTPFPVTLGDAELLAQEAAIKSASANMDPFSPRYSSASEKTPQVPDGPSTPSQQSTHFQYATDFENYNLGALYGQAGWYANPRWQVVQGDAVSGEKHLHYSAPLEGYPFIYSPRVTGNSESKTSIKVNVKLGSATTGQWQIVPVLPRTSYVITRIMVDFQRHLSVLVNDGNYLYHVEPVPVVLPEGYFEIALEVTRATSEFSLYLNGEKIFTGLGFAEEIEQLLFYADNGPMDIDDVQIIDGDLESLQYLTVNPTETTVPPGDSVAVAVNFNSANLIYSDYESLIHVTPAAGKTIHVPVQLSVTGDANLAASPVHASVTTGNDTTTQVSIVNTGGLPVSYAASIVFSGPDSTWLSLPSTTGTIPVATIAQATLAIDATNLPPGEYSAMLVITSNAPTIQVPIDVTVTTPAKLLIDAGVLEFFEQSYPYGQYPSIQNIGGSRLQYKIESKTTLRHFTHTTLTPLNSDPVSPGPADIEAVPNNALPFTGESYDDDFLNFLGGGNMNGKDGWAADGEDWFGVVPREYEVRIQGRSNGTGVPSGMYSTIVDQGSESVSSVEMSVNLLGSKGTTWQFIPQSPSNNRVVTRLQINPDQSIQVLVKNSDGTASFQHIRAKVPAEYFNLLFKVDRLTSKFTIFFNGQKVFTGQGFADQIEQMAFLSLMEKTGPSIFIQSYLHYNCSSSIQMREDWYFTDEMSGTLEPGEWLGLELRYKHMDLDQGEYIDSVKVTTNDPDQPVTYMPYTITVYTPFVEPPDYKISQGLKMLTDSIFAQASIGDSTTVIVTMRNDSDDDRAVYFPTPVEIDHQYRAYYNRSANFRWIDISQTGTKLDIGDDATQPIQLPFQFAIGYQSSDYISVGSNGIFGHGITDVSSPLNVPFGPYHELEVYNKFGTYWDDLVTDDQSGIYYTVDDEKLIVQYDNVLIFGTDSRNTFQTIFYKDGLIKYQYLKMDDRFSASIGLDANSGYYPLGIVIGEPFVADSLAIIFQYESFLIYDDETGFTTCVTHPWIKYPSAAITIPPHTSVDIPIQVSGLTTGISKGNISLLSYEQPIQNYPENYWGKIDGNSFIVPIEMTVLDNPPPVLGGIEDVDVPEGTFRNTIITATDPNDTDISFSLENAPSFISMNDYNDGTAAIYFQPQLSDVGSHAVVVKATDPHGAFDSDTLHVTVVRYSVTNFSLVNNETGEVLFDFTDGVTINQADPDFSTFTIRANTSPESVGSVKFKIDGSQVNIDNTNPYQLKNRHLLTLSSGAHVVLAEPFAAETGHEHRGESKQANVTVINATNIVTDFSLVNIVTGEVILHFNDAVSIDRARPDFMNLNIQANTLPSTVGSVKFKLDGTQRNIDSSNPYLLKSGFLTTLGAGNYTLLAEPFTGANGGGQRGQGKQAIVTIIEAPNRVVDFSLVNVVTGAVISNFTNTITLNRNRPDLANLTIRANTAPATVPSVKFKVNGTQRNIDNTAPYWLKTQLLPTLSTGENTLVAEPFSEASGHGTRGESREAKIILEDLPVTVSFSLVNVVTGQVISTFDQSISIDRGRADFASLNIRANTIPAIVGSVKFKINGGQRNIDSNTPYLLANQSLQTLPVGNSQLYGEPFTQSNGHGDHGQALEVTIKITEGTTTAMKASTPNTESLDKKITLDVYPVPVVDVVRFKTSEYDNRAFQMVVVSVMGQAAFRTQIASGALNGYELSTNSIGLASGVYYVHLVDASGVRVIKKMVKQ